MLRSRVRTRRWVRLGLWSTAALLVALAAAHVLLPWYTRLGTREDDRGTPLPGDDIVPDPKTGYTTAMTIHAAPSEIWPWLVQMGQGRAGFYTHEWIENLLGANIHNADRVVSAWQQLKLGDTVRLTPDPYFGRPGQLMTVAHRPERALVFRQTPPNGSPASWAFLLRPEDHGRTRVVMRRRGGGPTLFDRVMAPGYALMDRGMLHGLRQRAEGTILRGPERERS
jgi:hypothetical protein